MTRTAGQRRGRGARCWAAAAPARPWRQPPCPSACSPAATGFASSRAPAAAEGQSERPSQLSVVRWQEAARAKCAGQTEGPTRSPCLKSDGKLPHADVGPVLSLFRRCKSRRHYRRGEGALHQALSQERERRRNRRKGRAGRALTNHSASMERVAASNILRIFQVVEPAVG